MECTKPRNISLSRDGVQRKINNETTKTWNHEPYRYLTVQIWIRVWRIWIFDTNEYSNIFISKKQYERISEYIRIKKMIQTNIRIYSYQQNDMNEYPNIFVSNKWYEYDTNEYLYRKIFECTNTFVSIFYIGVRFDVICWIFVVWYNKKHSWHNKMEVICLWILICVWTILDLLVHTLDFSLEYIRIKKRYERISEYIRIKNDTNEYPNNYVSKKQYEYICIKKMIRI